MARLESDSCRALQEALREATNYISTSGEGSTHARYGSPVKFLQDGTRHEDFNFVVTIGSKGTRFIDRAPKLVLPKLSGESRRLVRLLTLIRLL